MALTMCSAETRKRSTLRWSGKMMRSKRACHERERSDNGYFTMRKYPANNQKACKTWVVKKCFVVEPQTDNGPFRFLKTKPHKGSRRKRGKKRAATFGLGKKADTLRARWHRVGNLGAVVHLNYNLDINSYHLFFPVALR